MLIGEKAHTFINIVSSMYLGASKTGRENSEKQLGVSAHVLLHPRATPRREVTSKAMGGLMEGKGHLVRFAYADFSPCWLLVSSDRGCSPRPDADGAGG